MANSSFFSAFFFVVLIFNLSQSFVCNLDPCKQVPATDNDHVEFASNVAYLGAGFFLNSATGKGLDDINSTLGFGGPPPIGSQIANLVGKLRAIIKAVVGGVARPLLNLSKEVFAKIFDEAFGSKLTPPFDPYANTVNFLIAANLIPYNGFIGLVKVIPDLDLPQSRKTRLQLAASLLGVEAGQDAVIRTLLYQRANENVVPYNITVAKFTELTSALSNRLAKCGLKDEGVRVPRSLGAENRTESNILADDANSLSYARTIQEILRIGYGTGDERVSGRFYPKGANGGIARSFLKRN